MQGHILSAMAIGDIYFWGKGVAKDYERAMAAYKIGAEEGFAGCQYELGYMFYDGLAIDSPDYEQALVWYEKAAAQDQPNAVGQHGVMYSKGLGVTPSWRRARELYKRAIELGNSEAMTNMQTITESIAEVTNCRNPPHTTLTPFT